MEKEMNEKLKTILSIVSSYKIIVITTTLPLVFSARNAYANIAWPAVGLARSHLQFWYVVIAGLLLEAGIFRWLLIPTIKKALFVSFVANAFSSTIGICLLLRRLQIINFTST